MRRIPIGRDPEGNIIFIDKTKWQKNIEIIKAILLISIIIGVIAHSNSSNNKKIVDTTEPKMRVDSLAKFKADSIKKVNICSNFGIYWKSEPRSRYSEIASGKISERINMQKSERKENGILLIYKEETKCKERHTKGLYECTYKANLSIKSCEINDFPSDELRGIGSTEAKASNNLKNKLDTANFWEKWKQGVEKCFKLGKQRLGCG
jgi:hypothetical protein